MTRTMTFPIVIGLMALAPVAACASLNAYYVEVFWGGIVGVLLMAIGFYGLRWSFEKSFQAFLGVIVGGILFRLAVLLGSGWFVIRQTDLSAPAYLLAALFYLLLFQSVELKHFHQRRKEQHLHAG